jgi:sec-independent protein translocase protein TatC
MADSTPPRDYDLEPPEVAVSPREKPMGFFDHLEELRWTLIKSVIVFVLFAILIGVFLRRFNDVLLWPLQRVMEGRADFVLELGTISIMEGFSVVLQMCFMGALVLSVPFVLFFIGQFVAPALHDRELKLLLPGCVVAFLLFLLGSAFSFFFLVPSTIRVSLELNELLGFTQRWTPGNYYGLLVWLVLGVGAAFEFPLVIIILVYLEIVSIKTLRKYRRHAVIAFFIIAAIVTPTPDPFTQTALALPLYGLFEIALLVGAQVEKRRMVRERAEGAA